MMLNGKQQTQLRGTCLLESLNRSNKRSNKKVLNKNKKSSIKNKCKYSPFCVQLTYVATEWNVMFAVSRKNK